MDDVVGRSCVTRLGRGEETHTKSYSVNMKGGDNVGHLGARRALLC